MYHGTSGTNAAAIAKTGFKSRSGEHTYPALWPTLTENRTTAEAYSHGDNPSVVEMHIPNKVTWEGGGRSKLWPAQEHMGGNAYAVKGNLPAKYVHAVHPVASRPAYPD